jgi:predicted nucleotidyltransferase
VIDGIVVAAVRLFLRLASATAKLLEAEPEVAPLFESPADDVHRLIGARLESLDPDAADDLREAFAWLRAILAALLADHRAAIVLATRAAPEEVYPSDEVVRQELRGSGGALFRGLLLTVAAVETLYGSAPLPQNVGRWCDLAKREVHAAANALRADSVAIPTAVIIPGIAPAEWRGRRASRHVRPEMLPPGVMDRIRDVLDPDEIWLFGSRGRGTHAPDSDWDLLVVLPDGRDPELARTHERLAPLRRVRVDLVVVSRSDFDGSRGTFGTLVNEVVTQGQRIHARG